MKTYNNFKFQKGASTLTIVLLLLIAIMLPAIAVMKRTSVNEQMTSSIVDRARAFQAAEATLLEAETIAATKPEPPNSGCSAGICNTPEGLPPWKSNGFWDSGQVASANTNMDGTSSKYIIEFLGISLSGADDCTTGGDVSPDAACENETSRYRITVRTTTNTGAEVILQSNFLAP